MEEYFSPARLVNGIKNDKFLSNSFIFFVGSFLVGAVNYLYQFLMARMLPVEVYGELQSLLAILAIGGVLSGAILTVLVKYTAAFKAKERLNKIYSLFLFSAKKVLFGSIIFFIVFAALSGYVADFLHLPSVVPVIILGVSFLIVFLSSINGGIIQGLENFKAVSIISIISSLLKVILAVLLVKLGFAINGAVGAIVLAGLIGYLISFLPIKFLFKQQKENIETKEIFRYSFPVFFTLLFITLIWNVDVVLVKHFFPAQTAGEYGALAALGRIIFFMAGPIAGVMFPMTAAAHSNHKDSGRILKRTVFLTGLIGSGILFFYFLFPEFIIKVLIGSKYLQISGLLGWFGLSMFFYSLVALLSRYFLSIGEIKCAYLAGAGVLLQIILISFFHQSLWQIVWIMNGVMFAVLALLTFYYFKIIIKKCPQS